ncbi:MAG: hypothetical protein JHC89_00200 [Acetobacteraceae bacterium]|jgi:hypothetical protein|nr:hypothetical protein [Acetobacteraceae bacterium]
MIVNQAMLPYQAPQLPPVKLTRKHHSAENKIRIVLEGLGGKPSIAVLCRR